MVSPASQNKGDRPAPDRTGYVGRFAPSPTGPLHFGSLASAVGSFLAARAAGGTWLVRTEDIDPPREVAGAARAQLRTLARFGMTPDRPATLQSASGSRHREALGRLLEAGVVFHCGCSRKDLPSSGIYPGTCRTGLPPGKRPRAVRFRVPAGPVDFSDRVQGPQRFDPQTEFGDFVVRRADGLIAYQLAVVVDDALQAVTEVVRGADLLDSTPRQLLLYRALGWAPPAWCHLPQIVDRTGRKLSKSDGDDPVERLPTAAGLRLALRALGHEPPAARRSLEAMWSWAIESFNPDRVPRGPITVTEL